MVRPQISHPVAGPEEGAIGLRRFGGCKFECAVAETQGNRPTHEDLVEVHCLGDVANFWVLDGHRGSAAAEFGGPALVKEICGSGGVRRHRLPTDGQIERGFQVVDNRLRKYFKKYTEGAKAGTTVVGFVATQQNDGKYDAKLINCGDSRGVIVRDVRPKDKDMDWCFLPVLLESEDHKPGAPSEKSRIRAAGGTITGGKTLRIDGNLAVSRGLGDFEFKADKKLSAGEQKVSSVPEVFEVAGLAQGTLVILACDGLWDVMTSEVAANFVRFHLQEFPSTDLGELAAALVYTALELGSNDNITVLLARLAGRPAAAGSGALEKVSFEHVQPYFDNYEMVRKPRRRNMRKDANSKAASPKHNDGTNPGGGCAG